MAREAGIDTTGVQTEVELFQRIRDQRAQEQQLYGFGRTLAPYATEVQEFLASRHGGPQQTPQAPAAPVEQQWYEKQWDAPPLDTAVLARFEEDQNGQLVPREEYRHLFNWGDVAQINQDVARYREMQGKMAANPVKFMYDSLRDKLMEDFAGLYREQSSAQQSTQALTQFEEENKHLLYALDDRGQVIYEPMSRLPVLSDIGKRFSDHVSALVNAGMKDQSQIVEQALANVKLEAYQLQQQQQAPPQIVGPNPPVADPNNPQAAQPQSPAPGQPVQPQPQPAQPTSMQQLLAPPQPAQPMSAVQQSHAQTQSFLNNAIQQAQYTPSATPAPPETPVIFENPAEMEGFFERQMNHQNGQGQVPALS